MDYEDFVLQLGTDARGTTVRVARSPAGESEEPEALSLLWDEGEIVRIAAAFARLAESKRNDRDIASPEVEVAENSIAETGGKLFRALFPDAVRSLYQKSLGRVAERGQGLRIRIEIGLNTAGATQLHAVPWEYLASDGHFLSLSREISIVRHLDLGLPNERPPVPAPLSILVLPGEDLTADELKLAEEQRELERAWGESGNVRIQVLRERTLDALREELLTREYHALHFMGHGCFSAATGAGTLAFNTKEGNRIWVSGTELAEELRDRSSLRLVFLNACRTAQASATAPYAGVATALLRVGIPAVIAMQFPISDSAALALSRAFYRRIARGDTVDAAVTEGRKAIRRLSPDNTEWGTPVLFERLTSGRIVKPANASPAVWRRWGTLLGEVVGSIGRRPGSPSQLSQPSLTRKMASWLLIPIILGVALLQGSLPRIPSRGARSTPRQGDGRIAPTAPIVPSGPSSALAGIDPRDLLIADSGRTTHFIDSGSGKVIATVGGSYEGTEIDNPAKVILCKENLVSCGEYHIGSGKSRWLTPFPSNISQRRQQLSPDRSRGIFFVNQDAWIVDLDWKNYRVGKRRQVTEIGVFENSYGNNDIRWASDNIVFVRSLRVDLSTGRVTEPFRTATPFFSPDSKYSIGEKSGESGIYVYDAISDTWTSLPEPKSGLYNIYFWISSTECIARQYDSADNLDHFWLIDVTKPNRKRHLLETPKESALRDFKAEKIGGYLSVYLSERTIVDIKSGRRLGITYEPNLFFPLGASQFILTSRSDGSLDERGTWLIDFETGSTQRITPYIAQQAVVLERKKLVFFAANGILWRAGVDGKGLVKLAASPPVEFLTPKPIKLP